VRSVYRFTGTYLTFGRAGFGARCPFRRKCGPLVEIGPKGLPCSSISISESKAVVRGYGFPTAFDGVNGHKKNWSEATSAMLINAAKGKAATNREEGNKTLNGIEHEKQRGREVLPFPSTKGEG